MSHKTLLNAWQEYQRKELKIKPKGELPTHGMYYIATQKLDKGHKVRVQYNQTLKRYEEVLDGEIIYTIEKITLRLFENDLRSVTKKMYLSHINKLGRAYIRKGC